MSLIERFSELGEGTCKNISTDTVYTKSLDEGTTDTHERAHRATTTDEPLSRPGVVKSNRRVE